MSVQTFGMERIRAAIQQGLDLARRAAAHIEECPMLELTTPVTLGIVCFRVNPASVACDEATLEKLNRKVLAHVFWGELAFRSSTLVKGVFSLRMCILNHTTTWDDVRRTLETVSRLGREALAEE